MAHPGGAHWQPRNRPRLPHPPAARVQQDSGPHPLHHLSLRRSSAVVEGLCEGHSDRLLLMPQHGAQSSLTPPHGGSASAFDICHDVKR